MTTEFYPTDWPTLAREIKAANDWTCGECGLGCRRPGEFYLGWQFELTVAHYFGEYEGATAFVACLCTYCHFKHDARHVWQARRRHDRWRQKVAGQLEFATA